MKSIYYCLAIASLALVSCKKFLTTQPTDTITTSNFYESQVEMEDALTTVYTAVIAGTYSQYIPCTFSTSDEAYPAGNNPGGGGLVNNPYIYQFDYTNSTINSFWGTLYTGIENANLLIANINKPSMDSATRQNILGQALFLRGFAYYLLVSHFGDVPLNLTPTANANNTSIPRTASAKVYASIFSDMETGLPLLQTAAQLTDGTRISQTAAAGILARVSLSFAGQPMNQTAYYDTAIYYCQQVVNSGFHALNTSRHGQAIDSSYAQIFINEAQDIFDPKECMFEANFSGTTTTYAIARTAGFIGFHSGIPFTKTYNDASIGYCYGFINATASLYRLYGTGDLRRDWAISPYYYTGTATNPAVSSAGIVHTAFGAILYDRYDAKWRREFETLLPKSKYDSPEDFPILRYADVLLMLAEAELQSSKGDKADALNRVNMVRRRGYGFDINTPNATSDLTSLALTDIQDERARELCFEGLRWTDLRRWGIFTAKMQATVAVMQADGLNARVNTSSGEPTTLYFQDGYQAVLNATSSSKFLLLPIPSSELNVNPGATQNPGY